MFAQESVMEIQNEKEAFERLPLAELAIESEFVFYNEETNSYWPNGDFCPSDAPETMNFAWEAWQAATTQAVPKGFVLVPQESLKVALFWMHEDIDPWQMGGDSFADLYEHKPILEKALVESQEPTND